MYKRISIYYGTCLLGLLLLFFSGLGQHVSNYRHKTLSVDRDTVQLDTLSIIPGSLIMEDPKGEQVIPLKNYRLLPGRGQLVWKEKPAYPKVKATYRVFPYDLSQTHRHKDTTVLEKQTSKGYLFKYGKGKGDGAGFSEIDWNGSLSRGISFGNNQDVIVNSNMNLQVSGMLTKEIEIMGAITDRNIPIQPEGNTQQLQDFDQVYLQFRKDASKLRVGDIELNRPDSYFMNYSKRVMGGKFETQYTTGENSAMRSKAALSVSKGKYARNEFRGQEGNQGPYRLTGNNGETYIIVLAGSERVYIDGKLMQRGAEHDYVIDYNLGEITFTPNRPITEDSRIVVEFEYAVRNYLRSLVHLEQEFESEKWDVRFNVYAEQDHKNQTKTEIDEVARNKMKQVGDSIDQAVVPGQRVDTSFNTDRIQYYLKDTVVDGTTYDSVFVFTDQSKETIYRVNFSNVGQGNGNYVLDQQSLANGRVYQWVAPVDGQPQGSYAPVVLQVTPKKQHMYTLGAAYKFSESSRAEIEMAVSNRDDNLFSSKDDGDDKGYATKIGYDKVFHLQPEQKKGWQMNTEVQYEHVNQNFTPLERYRPVEFTRDWNIDQERVGLQENIMHGQIGAAKGQSFHFDYTFTSFLRDTAYTGLKHGIQSHFKQGGFRVTAGGSYLDTRTPRANTEFFRPNAEISQWIPILKGIQIGAAGQRERNRFTPEEADTLTKRSFSFDIWELYAKSSDSIDNRYELHFKQRRNAHPAGEDFRLSNVRNLLTFRNELLKNPNNQLRWSVTYRQFEVKDSAHTQAQPDEAVIGRVEHNLVAVKGLIRSNTLYEVGQGQEQKRQFTYQKVPQGQGYYTWNDRNNDGNKQQDEFDKAYFSDQAQYVRVLLPTNEYQKTHTMEFNQSLNIEPRAVWHAASGFKKFISRFSTLSYFRMNRKMLETARISPFNPVGTNVVDTSLVSLNANVKNTLYFNRTGTDFGVDLTWKYNQNKIFLVNGAQSRVLDEKSARVRWNLTKQLTLRSEFRYGARANRSFTPTRNFHIDYQEVTPELTYLHQTAFRIALNYKYAFKKNTFNYEQPLQIGQEKMVSHDIGTSFRYTKLENDNISAGFSFIMIGFSPEANTNSPVAFNMLEGLQPGNNAVWNVSWERQLGGNMEMSLNYDGRKSEDTKMVHVGRAEVRYIF